ncbi:MAG TPA: hypothetical protein VK305_07565 [Roseateles sp.]|nr:hypothetical protein [Roseateles sp.]
MKAKPDLTDPQRAHCSFFTDYACTRQVVPPLSIPKQAGEVIFVQVTTADNWLLVGGVADRVDTAVVDPSFLPATFNQLAVPMPVTHVVTQGVLLIFSSQGPETRLYSSADPTVRNDDA